MVPIVVEGGVGLSEPIDAAGYVEFALYKATASKLTFMCQPDLGLAPLRIVNIGTRSEYQQGYFLEPEYKDLLCPWVVLDQSADGVFPDTLGYIYLK